MKSNLFLTALCLLLFAAIGQAQIAIDRAVVVSPPMAVALPAERELFIMGSADNITVGLQAPGDFTVDPSNLYQNPAVPPTPEDERQQIMEALGKQMEAASQRAMMKGMARSVWNGQGPNLVMFASSNNDFIADALGISGEQMKQIEERMDATFEQMGDPMEAAARNIAVEMGIQLDENGAPPDGWEPDMETIMKIQTSVMDMMESSVETMGSMINTALGEAFDEFLTPQQLQTMQESQLANMEALPFFSPSAFEALDLSDAQREHMEQIRQEYTPDFETMLDSWVDGYIAIEKRLEEEYDREMAQWAPLALEAGSVNFTERFLREYEEGQPLAPGEVVIPVERNDWESKVTQYVVNQAEYEEKMKEQRQEIVEASRSRPSRDEIRKKLLAEDPEYKRLSEAMQSKSKAFAENFKTQMFDVLTDEQWFRLEELIDNPPEHALAFRKVLRELLGGSDEKIVASTEGKESKKPEVWTPGPNSWRPGDPIPGGYQIERKSRFPREEN